MLWSRLPGLPLRLRKAFGVGDGVLLHVLANFFTDPADLAPFTTANCPSGANLRQAQRGVRILVARATVPVNGGRKTRALTPDSAKCLAVAMSSVQSVLVLARQS